MNKEKTNRLNGKDLINIGIFTAVYFILNLLIAAAMGFIPIVNMMIPFVSSLVLGIPMMLYFSKIKKFGMVLITYIIYGVILTLAGVGFYAIVQSQGYQIMQIQKRVIPPITLQLQKE